jgi:hypothetical protein
MRNQSAMLLKGEWQEGSLVLKGCATQYPEDCRKRFLYAAWEFKSNLVH